MRIGNGGHRAGRTLACCELCHRVFATQAEVEAEPASGTKRGSSDAPAATLADLCGAPLGPTLGLRVCSTGRRVSGSRPQRGEGGRKIVAVLRQVVVATEVAVRRGTLPAEKVASNEYDVLCDTLCELVKGSWGEGGSGTKASAACNGAGGSLKSWAWAQEQTSFRLQQLCVLQGQLWVSP